MQSPASLLPAARVPKNKYRTLTTTYTSSWLLPKYFYKYRRRYFLQVSHYRVRTQYSDFGSGADLTSLRLPVIPLLHTSAVQSLVKVTVCTPNWVKSYKCLQLLTSSWSTTSRAQTHSTFHTNSHNSQCCQHQQRLQPTSNNTTRTRHQAGDHAPTHSRSTKKTC